MVEIILGNDRVNERSSCRARVECIFVVKLTRKIAENFELAYLEERFVRNNLF